MCYKTAVADFAADPQFLQQNLQQWTFIVDFDFPIEVSVENLQHILNRNRRAVVL